MRADPDDRQYRRQLLGAASNIAKWIHEYHSENRLEGNHFFASFAMSF
jgi:hypothetical protein